MRWIIVLLLLVFFSLQFRLWFGAGSWEEIVALERKLSEQQKINQQLMDRNKMLSIEILDLKQGLKVLEERARSELGLIKENETFYLIVDD